jgi:hypothetical protein
VGEEGGGGGDELERERDEGRGLHGLKRVLGCVQGWQGVAWGYVGLYVKILGGVAAGS